MQQDGLRNRRNPPAEGYLQEESRFSREAMAETRRLLEEEAFQELRKRRPQERTPAEEKRAQSERMHIVYTDVPKGPDSTSASLLQNEIARIDKGYDFTAMELTDRVSQNLKDTIASECRYSRYLLAICGVVELVAAVQLYPMPQCVIPSAFSALMGVISARSNIIPNLMFPKRLMALANMSDGDRRALHHMRTNHWIPSDIAR